ARKLHPRLRAPARSPLRRIAIPPSHARKYAQISGWLSNGRNGYTCSKSATLAPTAGPRSTEPCFVSVPCDRLDAIVPASPRGRTFPKPKFNAAFRPAVHDSRNDDSFILHAHSDGHG